MLQAVAAFSSGLWVQHKLSDLQLPQLSRAVDEGNTFKLSVRVIAASVPGLSEGGLLTRERPRVAAVLGGVRKETEYGDCDSDADSIHEKIDSALPPCDWYFGETLTFAANVADVMNGQAVQLWLYSHSDVRLGPFQVNLTSSRDIGVCSIDVFKQILPECVTPNRGGDSGRAGDNSRAPLVWESPVLPFAVTHVGGSSGSKGSEFVIGQAAGHVLATFSVNVDPQVLLKYAEASTRPLVDRVADPFKQMISAPVRWVTAATELAGCTSSDAYCGSARCNQDPSLGPAFNSDLPQEGWLKHVGPNGREFWHHTSLGPAPWEQPGFRSLPPERTVSINGLQAGTEEDSILKLPSRDTPMIREGSRVFQLNLGKGSAARHDPNGGDARRSNGEELQRRNSHVVTSQAAPVAMPGGTASSSSAPVIMGHGQPPSPQLPIGSGAGQYVGLPRATTGGSVGSSFVSLPARGSFMAVHQAVPSGLPPSRSTFAQGEILVQPGTPCAVNMASGSQQHAAGYQSPRTPVQANALRLITR